MRYCILNFAKNLISHNWYIFCQNFLFNQNLMEVLVKGITQIEGDVRGENYS